MATFYAGTMYDFLFEFRKSIEKGAILSGKHWISGQYVIDVWK